MRERYVVGDGSDVGRMKRQQAFIASMAHQVVTAGTLARPDRLVRFLDSATKSLTVDPGLKNVVKLAQLGNQFKGIGLDNIQFLTIPIMHGARATPTGSPSSSPQADQVWAQGPQGRAADQAAVSSDVISAGNLPGQGPVVQPVGGPVGSPSGSRRARSPSSTPEDEASQQALANAGLCV